MTRQWDQKTRDTRCPRCGNPVIEFYDLGIPHHIEPTQAAITHTPLAYHQAGRMVWRHNLFTNRWGHEPAAPRGVNPVHLDHVCPDGQS